MKAVGISLSWAISLAALAPGAGLAQDNLPAPLAFRWGVPVTHLGAHFEQYEVSGPLARLWTSSGTGSRRASVRLDATAGAVNGGADTGYFASFGPSVGVGAAGGRVTLDAGSSVAVLSNGALGGHNFGGPIEFISHLGADVRVGRGVCVGYRIQHMSNAGLSDRNPGLNMHMFELRATPW